MRPGSDHTIYMWSPQRRVFLRLDGKEDVQMDLHQAAGFLQSFGERATILDLNLKPLVTTFEADILVQAMQRYSPSA